MNQRTPKRATALLCRCLGLMLALALLPLGGACGDDDDNGNPPIFYEAGPRQDGRVQFDILPRWDLPQPRLDGGADAIPSDGGVKPDGSADCEEPADVSCSPSCGQDELCTAASGGSCAEVFAVSGVANEKPALLSMATAIADCFLSDPGKDTLCGTLDTCNLEGDILKDTLRTWICDQAQISDYSTSSQYDAARDVFGCGWHIMDLDWQVAAVSGGEQGKICLIYDSRLLGDEVMVTGCENFPL